MEKTLLISLYLIIGHLIGDFLLQSSALVAYKHRSVYGIILHSLIIWFSHTLLFIPYLNSLKVFLIVTAVAFLHFCIDYTKIQLKFKNKYPIIPFLLDQLAHFIVLIFATIVLKNSEPQLFLTSWWFEILYQNETLLTYFAGVIFFSYTLDIVYLTFKLQKNANYQYKRGYFDMLLRVSFFALIYTLYSAYSM